MRVKQALSLFRGEDFVNEVCMVVPKVNKDREDECRLGKTNMRLAALIPA